MMGVLSNKEDLMSGSGVQLWSLPGSKVRALKRPWTGVGIMPDGTTFVVYDIATSRIDATPALAKLAMLYITKHCKNG